MNREVERLLFSIKCYIGFLKKKSKKNIGNQFFDPKMKNLYRDV